MGLQYSLENRQNFSGIPPLTKERIRDALHTAVQRSETNVASGKKLKRKPGGDLRKSLAVSITELPPVLVDHILQANHFDTTAKPADILENDDLLNQLVILLSEACDIVEKITSSAVCPGYIFAKHISRSAEGLEEQAQNGLMPDRAHLLYEDFHPFIPQKLLDDPSVQVLKFAGYNQTVDEFFSSLEGQKLESRLALREETAKRKLELARQDQAKRIEGLQDSQLMNFRKAAAIEANVERVQEAMDAVQGLIAQGMDWVDIGKLVEREQKRHNPVAEIINLPLRLSDNIITLTLAEEEHAGGEAEEQSNPYETENDDTEDESDDSSPDNKKTQQNNLTVDIVLAISPWGNAREYYDQRRTAAVKEEKTQLQATKALKSTEQKIAEDLKKGLKQEKALLQPIRTPMWFEKFMWFISSDGYLVIGGKDAQQNEMIYLKYLRKGDVYCHADLRGASSVVIKNKPSTPDAPIPPSTLSQAGSFSVCSSEAWDSKAGMSAWWVNADQVSKLAATGEFLPTGSFTVQGTRNFLPPAQLLLGLGIIFKVSEESKVKHVKHRLHDNDTTADSTNAKDVTMEKLTATEEQSVDITELRPKTRLDDSDESDGDSDANLPDFDDDRMNPLQTSHHKIQAREQMEQEMLEMRLDDHTVSNKTGQATKDEGEEENEQREDDMNSENACEPITGASDTLLTNSQVPTTVHMGPTKRGQKGKAKKIANKYKHQDEEDRAAAEALIGAAAGRHRAEAEAESRAKRMVDLEAAKERRRAQHSRKQKEAAEHEEARRAMMLEGVETPNPDDLGNVVALDALVGSPLFGDEILEAIPICAPWSALGRLKYKAKMQPGAMKKGKAVKEVMEKWKADSGKKGVVDESARDTEKMWPREVELIKTLKPEELVNCVPVGKVRIMMAGGASSGGGGGRGGGGQKGQSKGGRGGKGSKRS